MERSKSAYKPEDDGEDLLVADNEESYGATIDAGNMAHILKRLTDVYRSPIEATVRETFTNSVDANVFVPVEQRKPIEITSPSIAFPFYQIRDFAGGMSKEILTERYMGYGRSKKGEDLTQAGSHGLGGKSPMAYTNEYYGESTYEGVTSVFTMRWTDTGPRIFFKSSEFTGAPSGTTIKIPVKSEDFNAFYNFISHIGDNAFAFPVSIDGEIRNGRRADEYVEIKPLKVVELDLDLRAWVKKSSIISILTSGGRENLSDNLLLSGWLYGERHSNNSIIVEIPPGLVDFPSSRDNITPNSRLRELKAFINGHFINFSKAVDVLKPAMGSLDQKEVHTLAREFSKILEPDQDAYKIRSRSTNAYENVSREQLTLPDGEFIFDLLEKNRGKKNLGYSFEVSSSRWSSAIHMIAYGVTPMESAGIKKAAATERPFPATHISTDNYSVTELKSYIHGSSAHKITLSQASLAAEGSQTNAPRVIVTGLTEDKMVKVITGRRFIDSGKLFIPWPDETISDKELMLFAKLTGFTPETITADSMLESISLARKSVKETKANEVSETSYRFFAVQPHEIKDEATFINWRNGNRFYNSSQQQKTLHSLKGSKAVVILTDSRYRINNLLNGLLNSGASVYGKEILIADIYSRELTAAVASSLKGLPNLYIDASLTVYNSTMRDIKASYLLKSSNYLKSEEDAAGELEAFNYISSESSSRSFSGHILTALKERGKLTHIARYLELEEKLNELSSSERSALVSISREKAFEILGADFGLFALTLTKGLRNFELSSMEASLVLSLCNLSEDAMKLESPALIELALSTLEAAFKARLVKLENDSLADA